MKNANLISDSSSSIRGLNFLGTSKSVLANARACFCKKTENSYRKLCDFKLTMYIQTLTLLTQIIECKEQKSLKTPLSVTNKLLQEALLGGQFMYCQSGPPVEALMLEVTPLATQFFKRSYKLAILLDHKRPRMLCHLITKYEIGLSKWIFYVKNYQNLSDLFFHWRILV